MQTTLQTLTSSQLLDLRDTPIEVIPAQGSGFYIIPLIIILRTHAGSNVYGNLTTSLGIIINGVNILPAQMSTAILTNSEDSFVYYTVSNSASTLNIENCDNQPVYIKNTGLLELTGGNGTLDVQITFEVNNV